MHPSVSLRLPVVLGLLLAVQLVVALMMNLGGGPSDTGRPDTPLLRQSLDGIDRVEITGPEGKLVALQRVGDSWRLPGYFDAPADNERLDGMLQRLAGIQRGLPVATTASARVRFKVDESEFERRLRLKHGEETLVTLYLGESPGLRQIYARTAEDDAIYTIALAAHELSVEAKGWLDASSLAVEAASIDELELADGIGLKRNGDSWEAEGVTTDEPFNPAAAEALAMRLGGLRIEQLLGTEPPDDLRDAEAALQLTARTRDGEFTWTLWRRPESEAYVLHRSDRPWYAELAGWNAEPLIEAAKPSALSRKEAPETEAPGATTAETGTPIRPAD
jgi:hypothetical protein